MNNKELGKLKIEVLLKSFPEVNWDRWSGDYSDATLFGWVDRNDSYKDYVELTVIKGVPQSISTSSAKYSAEFSNRLDFTHSDCLRVEDYFNVPNVIKIKETKSLQSLLKQAELRGASEKLKSICRKHWQLPIPEQAMLDEITELEAELTKLKGEE